MRSEEGRRWREEYAHRQSRRRDVRVLTAPVATIPIGEFEYRGRASGIAVRLKPGGRAVRTFLHWCRVNAVYAEPVASADEVDDGDQSAQLADNVDFVLWVPVGQEGKLGDASAHDAVLSAYLLTNVRPPRASGAGEFRHGIRKPHPVHGYSGPGRAERQAETERERRAALPKDRRTAVESRDARERHLARLAHLASRVGPPSLSDEAEIGRLMAECGLV